MDFPVSRHLSFKHLFIDLCFYLIVLKSSTYEFQGNCAHLHQARDFKEHVGWQMAGFYGPVLK